MKQYIDLCKAALNGRYKPNRTGIGTVGIFGYQMRFDMSRGEFPLVTSKKVFTRGIETELKWFLLGRTDLAYLHEQNVHIWDSWQYEGHCGPIYGKIWREFPNGIPVSALQDVVNHYYEKASDFREAICKLANSSEYQPIDQLQELLINLNTSPFSRRHIVSAWAPQVLPNEKISPTENVKNGKQSLAACHTMFQLGVENMSKEEAFRNKVGTIDHGIKCINVEIAKIEQSISHLNRKEDVVEVEGYIKRIEYLTNLKFQYIQEIKELNQKYSEGVDKLDISTKRLSLQLYQRSADIPLGVPFNIASYALLLMILAKKSNMQLGDFIWTGGDCHVYENQIELLQMQCERESLPLPYMLIDVGESGNEFGDINNYSFDLIGYQSHPTIKYPLPAV